ncbi:MAG: DUF642 domain-containing protein [Pyrinomonadaceae bacterium]|nr:DUF642 domain-containing protein [Pyrinomonadaceae bacterium]
MNEQLQEKGYYNLSANSTQQGKILYWQITANNIDWLLSGVVITCSLGDHCIELTGQNTNDAGQVVKSGMGSITYTLTTLPKRRYVVRFDLAGNFKCGTPAHLRVSTASDKYKDFTFDTAGKSINNMGWVRTSWEFKPGQSNYTNLTFSSLDEGTCGPIIDNVVVVDVGP